MNQNLLYVVHSDNTEETYAYENYRIENGVIIVQRLNSNGLLYDAILISSFKKVFTS